YLDFGDAVAVLSSNERELDKSSQKAIQKLSGQTAQLAPIRNRVMHSRPLQYDDLARLTNLTNELLSFPTFLFENLRQTKLLIESDPGYVFTLELDDFKTEEAKTSHNLPIPDFDETGFIGRAEEERELIRIVKTSPWPVVTVLGEGGLGKTALALKVAYAL